MSQHAPMRQQILTIALTAFNQYGNALTLDQLTARLSASPSSLHPYFNSKPELIRQLVSFILTRIRQLLSHSLIVHLPTSSRIYSLHTVNYSPLSARTLCLI